jgi:hypothetical protein
VHFVGRLATYKYLNMDQVVAQALALFRDLMDRTRTRNPYTGSLYPTEANWAAATRIDATTSTT